MTILERLLNELRLVDVDKNFPTVPKEVKTYTKNKYKKGNDVDKRGVILLDLYKKGEVESNKVSTASGYLLSLSGDSLNNINTYDDLKKRYDEQKNNSTEEPKKDVLSTVQSKDLGNEVLFFPQSHAQLKSFSTWMAKKDTEGTNVNHWCVATDRNDNHEGYKQYGNRYIIIVRKKDGKVDWNSRYLYAVDDDGKTEIADKTNAHSTVSRVGFSEKTTTFIRRFGDNSSVNPKKKEGREMMDAITKRNNVIKKYSSSYDNGILTMKDDLLIGRDELFDIKEVLKKELKEIRNISLKEGSVITFQNSDWLNKISFSPSSKLKELSATGNYGAEGGLFEDCSKLTSIVLPSIESGYSINRMFSNCNRLKTIKNLEKVKIRSMYLTFSGCEKLTSLPALNVTECYSAKYAFNKCNKLKSLDMNKGSWTFTRLMRIKKREEDEEGNKDDFVLDFSSCPLSSEVQLELKKRNPTLEIKFKGSER